MKSYLLLSRPRSFWFGRVDLENLFESNFDKSNGCAPSLEVFTKFLRQVSFIILESQKKSCASGGVVIFEKCRHLISFENV